MNLDAVPRPERLVTRDAASVLDEVRFYLSAFGDEDRLEVGAVDYAGVGEPEEVSTLARDVEGEETRARKEETRKEVQGVRMAVKLGIAILRI